MTPKGNTEPGYRAEQDTSSPLGAQAQQKCHCWRAGPIHAVNMELWLQVRGVGYIWLSSPDVPTWLNPFLLRKMPPAVHNKDFGSFVV